MTEPRSPLFELTMARLRLFLREPGAVFWTFGFPILLSIALGIAFRNRAPEPTRVAIAANSGAERILAELGSPLIKVTVEDEVIAAKQLRSGKVTLVIVPGDPLTYRYDETRPEARLARMLVDDILQRADGRTDPVRVADERVTEAGARYIDFLIPGLVGFNLMSSSMWGIGYSIVDMRTKKLIKRLMATPMRRSDFLLSFIIVRALFVAVEVPVLFGFGWIGFGVRVFGSPLLLLGLSFLGAFTFAGLGLLVACRAQNTETVSGLMNLVILPMSIASGVFFSTSNFPDRLQPLLRALPLTALNDALRAVTNDGAGLVDLGRPIAVLGAFGLLSYAAALKMFRWQ
ncbi:MAG: ABC transporter permease [Myxococcota bacterium]|nr:ABC transporter permease [Myxococcota bacterium]